MLLNGRGLLARLFRPLFGMVNRSWHMAPLGFLFGLGFDTATEVTLLGILAAQGAKGLGLANLLIFPAIVAIVIGSAEVLALIGNHYGFMGPFWSFMDTVSSKLGFAVIGLFALFWLLSVAFYHIMGYEHLAQTDAARGRGEVDDLSVPPRRLQSRSGWARRRQCGGGRQQPTFRNGHEDRTGSRGRASRCHRCRCRTAGPRCSCHCRWR